MAGDLDLNLTQAGATLMWAFGGPRLVPHLPHKGLMLTPRIETAGVRREARNIMGLPVAELTHDGRHIYALPGGLSFVGPPSA